MEHFDPHNHYKDVDFKKGFKKPLPFLIILFILIVFSILYYLDSSIKAYLQQIYDLTKKLQYLNVKTFLILIIF